MIPAGSKKREENELSDTTSVYLCIFLISRFTNRPIFYSINCQSTNVFHFWIFSLWLKRISWFQFLLSAPFEKPGLVGFRDFSGKLFGKWFFHCLDCNKNSYFKQKTLKPTLISVALINLGPIGFGLSFNRGFPARTRVGITRFGTGWPIGPKFDVGTLKVPNDVDVGIAHVLTGIWVSPG